jgi:hypothetical protein
MGIVIDKILGQALLHEHPVRNTTTDPTTAKSGTLILNTTDYKVKIFFLNAWFVLADLSLQLLLDETGTNLLSENNELLLIE